MLKRSRTNASAKVVDGSLIITLPDAKNPVVWRMALGETRAAALEVIARGDEHVLILKTPKGSSTDIAPFDKREQASDALMAVARAMEQAEGRIKPASGASLPVPPKREKTWKWLIPLALILAALFFFSQTASMTAPVGTANTAGKAGGGANDIGVPLSADSFLSGF